MKSQIVVEYDPATGSYAAYCPEVPACCSAAAKEEEALRNAQEAIVLYLEPAPLKLKVPADQFTPRTTGLHE